MSDKKFTVELTENEINLLIDACYNDSKRWKKEEMDITGIIPGQECSDILYVLSHRFFNILEEDTIAENTDSSKPQTDYYAELMEWWKRFVERDRR